MSQWFARRASLLLIGLLLAGAASLLIARSHAERATPFRRLRSMSLRVVKRPRSPFWRAGVSGACREFFQHVDGVISAVSGYAGGKQNTAHYETVGTGVTGHAESVRITFDPRRISYGRILQSTSPWRTIRPSSTGKGLTSAPSIARRSSRPIRESRGRQGLYHPAGRSAHAFDAAIVTTIEPNHAFYPAEAYHQDFLTRHPTNSYIVFNDLPKIDELRRIFPDLYRADPVLVTAGNLSN